MVEQAKALGVAFYKNSTIINLTSAAQQVRQVLVKKDSGDELPLACEHLFWTGPSALLHKLAQLPKCADYRPVIRKTILYHIAFEHPFLVENNYVDINDPKLKSFRVTLYPNLSQRKEDVHRCTVEVMLPQEQSPLPDAEIIQELVDCGIVDAENIIVFVETDCVYAGFPVMTPEFFAANKAYADCIEEHLKNVSLLGKASGKHFFMHDVLVHAHNTITSLN